MISLKAPKAETCSVLINLTSLSLTLMIFLIKLSIVFLVAPQIEVKQSKLQLIYLQNKVPNKHNFMYSLGISIVVAKSIPVSATRAL